MKWWLFFCDICFGISYYKYITKYYRMYIRIEEKNVIIHRSLPCFCISYIGNWEWVFNIRYAAAPEFLSSLFLGDISCTFSHSTRKVKCGDQECSAITDNTPIGYYKLGAVEWNSGKRRYWVNLYPKKINGNGYWDYYCANPDTGRSKIALHPGSISFGCISIPDSSCWFRLEAQLKQQNPNSALVTGVQISGAGNYMSFSCNGGLAAGKQITKTVSVIGSLQVTK